MMFMLMTVGSTTTAITIFISLLLICFIPISQSFKFESLCSIHQNDKNYDVTRKTSLLVEVHPNSSWLYPTTDQIYDYYVEGKRECEKALKNDNNLNDDNDVWNSDDIFRRDKCRGNRALFAFTGMMIWPFGPMHLCPTYSKCWFGLLSCGNPKLQQMTTHVIGSSVGNVLDEMNVLNRSDYNISRWSIKGLLTLMRVIGSEIVVPEQRYLNLNRFNIPSANGAIVDDDIIIAQYHLTRPRTRSYFSELSSLEIRLYEFYPIALMNWDDVMIVDYGIHNFQVVYLGWNEYRCDGDSSCSLQNTCCGCELESFVHGTPVNVSVPDRSENCLQHLKTQELPICKPGNSNLPGRWIASSLRQYGLYCNGSNSMASNMKENNHRSSLFPSSSWYEASGNPCLINSDIADEAEDGGQSHWFYAPYSCRYNFYTLEESFRCFADKNISHIHVAGDSMSRDFLSYLCQYFGERF